MIALAAGSTVVLVNAIKTTRVYAMKRMTSTATVYA